MLTLQERVDHYHQVTGYPQSLWVGGDGRISGTWIMGNNYKVKSKFYGGYPAGYLRRVKALFPDKTSVLHLFSGKVDVDMYPGDTVDIRPELNPTYLTNAETMEGVILPCYDLVLADPPYSVEDCEHYGTAMVNRNKVMKALEGLNTGSHVVWLDQTLCMYRKDTWRIVACIGMLRSTNHRFRMITVFERL
jgi:hypothetical protein